jgi:hypothetical protein
MGVCACEHELQVRHVIATSSWGKSDVGRPIDCCYRWTWTWRHTVWTQLFLPDQDAYNQMVAELLAASEMQTNIF